MLCYASDAGVHQKEHFSTVVASAVVPVFWPVRKFVSAGKFSSKIQYLRLKIPHFGGMYGQN